MAMTDGVAFGLAKYQDNPIAYVEEVLDVHWWAKQKEIAMSIVRNKRTLVKAAFGVGKTHASGGIVNWWYDCFDPDDTKIVTTAPTGNQVKNLLWVEIRSQRRTSPPAGTVQIKDYEHPDHLAIGLSPSRSAGADEMGAQAFQGMHAKRLLVIFDEAAGVSVDRWATAEDLIVGRDNRMLAIGNPTVTSGPFYDAARNGLWNVITISALEHPNILAALKGEPEPIPGAVSLAWVMERLNNPHWCEFLGEPEDEEEQTDWYAKGGFEFQGLWYLPGPLAEAKILGRFPSQPTDTIWALTWLELARTRDLSWGDKDILNIGVDVARFGDDASTFHSRIGPCSLNHASWRKMDTMETAGRVYRRAVGIMGELETNKCIIRVDTSYASGAGVADRLREVFEAYDNVQIIDVNSSGKANEPEFYPNVRSELWFTSAHRGRTGDLDLSRLDDRSYELLASQLTAPKWKMDSRGRSVAEGKDDTKRRIQRSPDDADAFNLAYIGGQEIKLSQMSVVGLKTWHTDSYRPPTDGAKHETSPWTVGAPAKSRWSQY